MKDHAAVHGLRLLLCVLLWSLCVDAVAGGRYALVVGNASYRGADRLGTADADAALIAERLRHLGFNVSLHTDRSRRDLLDDVDAFVAKADKADVALFYYAGHGFEVDGENYLMPVDLSRPLDALGRADLRREGVALGWVQAALARSGAQARVFLVDACRAAPARGGSPRGMGREGAANGSLLVWSTAPGSTALDSLRQLGMPVDHSPFAWYLAANLEQPGQDVIGVVQKTQAQVSVATGGSQRPWYSSGLVGTLRLDRDGGAPAIAAGTAPFPAAGRTRGATSPSADRQLWDREDQAIAAQWQSLDAPGLAGLRKRAAAGDPQAAVLAGMALEHGRGAPANPARAMDYYRQAARTGYAPGQTLLGEALYEGRWLPRDLSAAERLLQSATDAGYTRASLDLAQLHAERGDPQATQEQMRALFQMGASMQDLLQQQSEQVHRQIKDASVDH
jgi:uncharacterized caspase-like protein